MGGDQPSRGGDAKVTLCFGQETRLGACGLPAQVPVSSHLGAPVMVISTLLSTDDEAARIGQWRRRPESATLSPGQIGHLLHLQPLVVAECM
jgi:hypothetical protein